MRWALKTKPFSGQWKPWFAWYPVIVILPATGVKAWLWLEWIERRDCSYAPYGEHLWTETYYRIPIGKS
jgi:hypothetical protein